VWQVGASCGAWASHCGGFSQCPAQVLGHVGFSSCGFQVLERRLSGCGAWAPLLHGLWDLPRSGIKPMSPALAGGFFTTEPPGKPGFLSLGSSFGLLLMEKGKKSFVVSYFPGSPLSLSFSPPLLLLILKQQIPF